MIKWEEFKPYFNRSFWKAFHRLTLPIRVPQTAEAREVLLRGVFDSIVSARYAPSIPEAEMIRNKGFGVARTIPVSRVEDYVLFYF
jgi:hypothetical protein